MSFQLLHAFAQYSKENPNTINNVYV